jgi:hypothetical protein
VEPCSQPAGVGGGGSARAVAVAANSAATIAVATESLVQFIRGCSLPAGMLNVAASLVFAICGSAERPTDGAALRRAATERGGPLPSIDLAGALLEERMAARAAMPGFVNPN